MPRGRKPGPPDPEEKMPADLGRDVWRELFIAALRNSGNIRAACQRAGVSRAAAYKLRNSKTRAAKEFVAKWDDALLDAVDVMAAEARRRAMTTSDTLLIYLLKIHGGEFWRQDQRQRLDINVELRDAVTKKGRAEGFTDAEIEEAIADAERIATGR